MPDFRTITARFTAYVPDSADADHDPDPVPVQGSVVFEPNFARGAISYTTPEFVVPEPIHAQLIDGELVTSVAQGDEIVYQPVRLMVTEDERSGQRWTWTARFRDVTIQDEAHEISDLTFTVPPGGGPLDLAEVVGTRAGGTITVRGPRGPGITSITAADGELRIAWEGGTDVIVPVPDAVPGPEGPRGPQGPGVEWTDYDIPLTAERAQGSLMARVWSDGRVMLEGQITAAGGSIGVNSTLAILPEPACPRHPVRIIGSGLLSSGYRQITLLALPTGELTLVVTLNPNEIASISVGWLAPDLPT